MLFNSFNQNKLICRQFHTSSPRHVHPLLWVFLKPALKGVAWLTGRSTRKWYRELPPEKRSIFTQHLNRNKHKYIGIFGTMGAAVAIHFYTHLETVPITGRKCYMVVNAEKLQTFFNTHKENTAKEHFHTVFHQESKQTQLVARVARRIIASNMDIPGVNTIQWSVRVLACYDVRESVDLWQTQSKSENGTKISEFWNTHPASAKRAEDLNEIVPWALGIRHQCNCVPLGHKKSVEPSNISKDQTKKYQSL